MTKFNPCPCCGSRTLEKLAPGTYQICPVCFWEDTRRGERKISSEMTCILLDTFSEDKRGAKIGLK